MLIAAIDFTPDSFLFFYFIIASLLWGVFGTVLVRWICSALNGIHGLYQLAEAERRREALARRFSEENDIVIADFVEKPPARLLITVPTHSQAFGLVFANGLVIGIAGLAVGMLKMALESIGESLHPAQVIGLVVSGLLAGLFVLWINRRVLMASWISTVIVSVSYLLGTFILTATVFRLVQLAATNH